MQLPHRFPDFPAVRERGGPREHAAHRVEFLLPRDLSLAFSIQPRPLLPRREVRRRDEPDRQRGDRCAHAAHEQAIPPDELRREVTPRRGTRHDGLLREKTTQIRRERGRVRVPPLRLGIKAAMHDRLKVARDAGADRPERNRHAALDRAHRSGERKPRDLEGRALRQQLVRDHPEGVNIRPRAGVSRVPRELLGRHVPDRPHELPLLGDRHQADRRVPREAGDPEVEHLGLSRREHKDVVRLEVAVHNAPRVRVPNRTRDRREQLNRPPPVQALRVHRQRRALDVLHREERPDRLADLRGARLVDLGDPRVLQSSLDLRFLPQPLLEPATGADAVDDLDRDAPPGARLLRLKNDAHPALADPADDAVAPDPFGKRRLGGRAVGRLEQAVEFPPPRFDTRLRKRAGSRFQRQQLEHIRAERRIAAPRPDPVLARRLRLLERLGDQLRDPGIPRRIHHDARSSRASHSRATCQSRFTVGSLTPSNSAISGTRSEPSSRSSATRA